MSTINKVTVLGSGVLGGQIAWQSAFKGKTVVVYDILEDALERARAAHEGYAGIYREELGASDADIVATKARLTYTTDIKVAANADLVIEAVPEVPAIKTSIYKELAGLLPAHTLIATNTSTLLPSDFAAATGRPEKYCALHFANMIWSRNVIEIMAHAQTSRETLLQATEFAIEIGQVPIPVLKEQGGYLINTWEVPLLNAAQTLVTNGIATAEDVDRTFLFIFRSEFGPMGLLDIVGMRTAHAVFSVWGEANRDAQMTANAAYIKKHFLDKGRYGLSNSKGYYEYPNPAYKQPGFLGVPDISVAQKVVNLALPG